jgi:hypothetical protein
MKLLNQMKANCGGGGSPFNIVYDSTTLHSRWLLLLKIEISSIVHCSYMAMSSLTYILDFSVKFFQPVYSV